MISTGREWLHGVESGAAAMTTKIIFTGDNPSSPPKRVCIDGGNSGVPK
jgi:hypothetical protein